MSFLHEVRFKNFSMQGQLIRAATFEGYSDPDGFPSEEVGKVYEELAKHQVPLIIAGFVFPEKDGHAMQTAQGGLHCDEVIPYWAKVIAPAKALGAKMFVQISHAGRQTTAKKGKPCAPSAVRCTYFGSRPRALTVPEIDHIIDSYAQAAVRAKKAGFDGVQIHCAHGYLIHQFLSPHTNRRNDAFGGSPERRREFALRVVKSVKEAVGSEYPVILKLSVADDRAWTVQDAAACCVAFEQQGLVDAIELSYGTMEWALNIFRGGFPLELALKHNELFNKYHPFVIWLWRKFQLPKMKAMLKRFTSLYNLENALVIRRATSLPLILTGGIRNASDLNKVLESGFVAGSCSRPFVCEPDFLQKISNSDSARSACTNCNICAVMCDSGMPTRCHTHKWQPKSLEKASM